VSELADEVWTVEPRSTGWVARWHEVWRYRRMFLFFGTRAVQRLYRNTLLGKSWILLRPLVPLLVRVFIFGALLNLDAASPVPYFLFMAVGSAAWELFASSVMWVTRSLDMNSGMLSRLYVPRIIIPMATMAPALLNFGINVGIIAVALVYYRATTGIWYLDRTWLVVAPVAAVLIVGMALSIGLWTSVLATAARDVRFILGYILEFWVYLTPVVYPMSLVPEHLRWVMTLNPMAVFVVAFRGAILGGEGPTPMAWVISLVLLITALAAGLAFFHRAEAEAVDNL
jgi:lipopolysaccharide transport system permease protein